jgi:hypothetical protein
MKTYSVLIAIDVPHYGLVDGRACSHAGAFRAARRNDPDANGAVHGRIGISKTPSHTCVLGRSTR